MKRFRHLIMVGFLLILSQVQVAGADGGIYAEGTVGTRVVSGNQPPVADAGRDQTVKPGSIVTLNGSNSSDPDGHIASYRWMQKAGSPVTLSDPQAPTPTFVAPNVDDNGTALIFELIVTDSGGLESADTTTVFVSDGPSEEFPSVGGSQMGKIILYTVNPDEFDGFNLLLSQQVLEKDTGIGRIYLSIEVVGITGMEGLMWFRPSDDRVPTYLKLAKGREGFLPGAEENAFFEGRLTAHPRDFGPFFVGDLQSLRGVVLIFKTWYIRNNEEFNADHLKHIQTVIVSVQSNTDLSVPVPTIGGHEARGPVVDEIVLYNMDPDFTTGFNLLLSKQAADVHGRLFVSLEVLGIPQWEDFMWFRPADDQTPPYVVLSKTEGRFLELQKEVSFFKGILSGAPADIGPFFVGSIERGLVLIFKTWYLKEGDVLDNDHLRHIQTIMVAAPSLQIGR